MNRGLGVIASKNAQAPNKLYSLRLYLLGLGRGNWSSSFIHLSYNGSYVPSLFLSCLLLVSPSCFPIEYTSSYLKLVFWLSINVSCKWLNVFFLFLLQFCILIKLLFFILHRKFEIITTWEYIELLFRIKEKERGKNGRDSFGWKWGFLPNCGQGRGLKLVILGVNDFESNFNA